MPSSTWYVYIVLTSGDLFYTGIATDVERRFREHRDMFEGKPNARGARYFRGHEPVAVVYREVHESRQAASRREYAIKRLSRAAKRKLVESAGAPG